jgi:hypothetical protein
MQRKALGSAVLSALGLTATGYDVLAGPVEPGAYELVILPTPVVTNTTGSGATSTGFKFGKDGAWSSSFSFGGPAPSSNLPSQGMTDNALGGGIGGDSFVGILGITIADNGALAVTSFSKDAIFATAGATFTQYLGTAGTSLMTGSVDLNNGSMSLTPTGRLGATTNPTLADRVWNISNATRGPTPSATEYLPITTGSASTYKTGGSDPQPAQVNTTINGMVFSNIGDVNLDGIDDYSGVLVSGGTIGPDWASFDNANFFETWNSRLLSKSPRVKNDTLAVFLTTPRTVAVLANDQGKPTLIVDDPLTPNASTQGGSVVVNTGASPNTITYTAPAGFTGQDSFMYTARDGDNNTGTATVTVTVSSQSALASSDTGATKQGQPTVPPVDVDDNDSSVLGTLDPSTVAITAQGSNGTAVSNANGTVTYTPVADFVGQDTFTYTIRDDVPSTSDPATVTITVTPGPLVSQGTYGNGTIAASLTPPATNGVVGASDIPVADTGITASCVGGCFDFIITGAAATTKIVLPPLGLPINTGSNLRYRKFTNGAWEDFDTTGGDSIASAPKSVRGGCPAPGNAAWKTWTASSGISPDASHQDDECLELTINDAIGTTSTNDSNSAAGTIADPGGLGSNIAAVQPSGTINSFQKNTSGGCTISVDKPGLPSRADWLVLGLIGAWLGALRLRRSKPAQ